MALCFFVALFPCPFVLFFPATLPLKPRVVGSERLAAAQEKCLLLDKTAADRAQTETFVSLHRRDAMGWPCSVWLEIDGFHCCRLVKIICQCYYHEYIFPKGHL